VVVVSSNCKFLQESKSYPSLTALPQLRTLPTYQDANDPYEDYRRLICYSHLVSGGSSNSSEGFNRFALQIGVRIAGRAVRIPRPADRQSVKALISQGAREQGEGEGAGAGSAKRTTCMV
jgi:hypothetical protein